MTGRIAHFIYRLAICRLAVFRLAGFRLAGFRPAIYGMVWLSLCLAATSTGQAESFQQALALTLAENPELRAARSRYLAVKQSQIVAFSEALPQVQAYARSSTNDTSTFDARTGVEDPDRLLAKHRSDSWGVDARMTVFASGKNFSDFMKTRADIQVEQMAFRQVEQSILLAAITAYLDVVRDEALLSLRRKNVAVLERRLEATRDRLEVGIVTRTDLALSESRLQLAQAGLIAQQAALTAARARYVEVIGRPPQGRLAAPETLPPLPIDLASALAAGRRQSPILRAARENDRSASYASYSAIASTLPRVSLFGTYSVTEDPNRMKQGLEEEVSNVGVEVTMPLFLGGKSYAAITAARHLADNSIQQVHAASNQVEREVTIAWAQFTAANGRIQATDKQIKAAEIALEGTQQEYELGIRSILDLLDAETELLDARVAHVEGGRDRIIAAFAILAAIGELTGNQLDLPPVMEEKADTESAEATDEADSR